MISKRLMQLVRLSRNLTVRVILFTLLALAAVLVAPLAEALIPARFEDVFGEDAVLPLLNILASSMLTVTTFSLGVMVQASQSASSLATPRAYRIVMADTVTQSVLATFVGSFLYALTAIALLRSGFYGQDAHIALFLMTVAVIAAIIVAIIRWIAHLSQLGSMDHVLDLVQEAARPALQGAIARPALGAHPADPDSDPPACRHEIRATGNGYVQFIDMPALQSLMEQEDGHLWVVRAPGAHVMQGDVLACTNAATDAAQVCACFTIGRGRSQEQDARYGLLVLAETAARALSPGTNDPGTAIEVLHRLTELMHGCDAPDDGVPMFDRLTAPAVSAADLLQEAFDVIIRDGAGRPEVIAQVVAAMNVLRASPWPEMRVAAKRTQRYALRHANVAISQVDDRDRIARTARGDGPLRRRF